MSRAPHPRAKPAVWSIQFESCRLPFGIPLATFPAAREGISSGLLPVAVDLVPLLDPFVAQLDVLLEVRRPRLDDFRIVARRIERRGLPRSQIAQLPDLGRPPPFRHAPLSKTLRGIRLVGG